MWTDTSFYKKYKGINYIDLNSNKIIEGLNGLDYEDGTWRNYQTNPMIILIFLLIAIAFIVVIYYCCVFICCPADQTISPTIYIRFRTADAV